MNELPCYQNPMIQTNNLVKFEIKAVIISLNIKFN